MQHLVARILRWLTSDALADSVLGDLEELRGERRRRSRWRAAGWYAAATTAIVLHALAHRIRELAADGRSRSWSAGALGDVRHAVRVLVARPAFTLTAVLTLTVGIGANTAIFSAVTSLLVRPLPVADVDRLVYGFAVRDGFDPFATSILEYLAHQNRPWFASSGLAIRELRTVSGRDDPERLQSSRVTGGFLPTLGVTPAIGRLVAEADAAPGAPAVAVIGHDLWLRRYQGSRDVLGQPLLLDDGSYTIVGVLPPGFDVPEGSSLWLPMRASLETLPLEQQTVNGYQFIARLSPGTTVAQADADVRKVALALEQDYPQFRRGWSYRVIPLRQQLLGDLAGRSRQAFLVLEAAVGFLLLICCANVASLVLVRGVAREREIAVRLALGAGRARVLRQLFTESACLALAGGAGGLALAYWLTPVLQGLNPIRTASLASYLTAFTVDTQAVLFALTVSVGTGLLFGMMPALAAVRVTSLAGALKRTGPRAGAGNSRLLSSFVVVELAIAVALLVNGGLIVQSFIRLQQVDLGFDPQRLLTLQLTLSSRYQDSHEQRALFAERLIDAVENVPGVEAAGLTSNMPMETFSVDARYLADGPLPADTSVVPITAHRLVSDRYLQTLGVRLESGRLLTAADRAGTESVVVVTRAFATEAWPGADPIGKRVRRVRRQGTSPWMTVVGVVADVKEDRFNYRTDRPAWYIPYAQDSIAQTPITVVIRAAGSPTAIASEVRQIVRTIDPQLPVSQLQTMTEHLSGILVTERFSATLMTALGAVGLFLAAGGLYGVIAYSVSQRTTELGLRMALGAARRRVMLQVMKRAVLLIAAGVAAGCIVARIISVELAGSLFEVETNDPLTFLAVAILLGLVGVVASLVPAARATRIDPVIAIRSE